MSAELILELKDLKQTDIELVGGKAANIGDLARGLKTPHGFCLTVEGYKLHLKQNGAQDKIAALLAEANHTNLQQLDQISEQIRNIITDLPVPPQVEAALREHYQSLGEDLLVAVRSSATAEDRPDASFAGQQDSFLNVQGADQVILRVKDCWASLWTSRAMHYRARKGYNTDRVWMAVLIQEMVPAQISGVMFTANPVNNSRKEIVIEAVPGLGEALVSGELTGEHYVLEKEGYRLMSARGYNTARGPMLNDGQLRQLAHYGYKIEKFYDSYQDIEWSWYKGDFYFLQARPITTLADEVPVELDWSKLTPIQKEVMTNVLERFPQPILPIDAVVTKLFFAAQFESLEKLGYQVPQMDWTRVEQGMFPEFFIPPAIKGSWWQVFSVLKIFRVMRGDPATEWRGQSQYLQKMLSFVQGKKLEKFPFEIVFEYLNDAMEELHLFIVYRYGYFARNRMPSRLLAWFLRRLFGSEAQELHESLLAGIPNLTLETNQQLRELAVLAEQTPAVAEIIAKGEIADMEENLRKPEGGPEFLQAFAAFMDKYGDRETSIGLGGLGVPTWREEPDAVWGILRGLVTGGIALDLKREQAQVTRREQAEARLRERLSRGIWKVLPVKGLINRLIRHNRSFAAFREDSHFDLTRALSVLRRLFRELGNRFYQRELLEKPDDIMYLTYWEMKNTIYDLFNYGRINERIHREKVQSNRELYERRLARWIARKAPRKAGATVLKGVPSSSGTATGPARIITDPRDFYRLQPGDILVAPYTNPAWTPLFASAVAIVADTGGATSHAAIIAREYGIPAVMGAAGASTVLTDGEIITVNGTLGTVNKRKKQG
ncbi:MAG TPA: PEP/pyruvate-binding domain-containing protein [Bacillota bacterium]|nr:PEP/pyruvate-binding domain-containing protein [Bacillota bacterium]